MYLTQCRLIGHVDQGGDVFIVRARMLAPRYTVGFTGHRAGFAPEAVRATLSTLLVELVERASLVGKTIQLCTSIAEGCDTVCVQLARQLNIPVHLLLPLKEEEFAKDFTAAGWALAATELAAARTTPERDTIRLIESEAARPGCYFNLALEMLRAADMLVAVTDGMPSRGPGGTRSVIELAAEWRIPVIEIDAMTGVMTTPWLLERVFQQEVTPRAAIEWTRLQTSGGMPRAATPVGKHNHS